MKRVDIDDLFKTEKEKKRARMIRMDEYEMKKIILTREQVVLALRNYIKTKAVPPRDANINLQFHGDVIGNDVDLLSRLNAVHITWSEFSTQET